jgi:hypothetical protein
MILLTFLISASAQVNAETINLQANFRLYGEVCRFGLGRGSMELYFGVNESASEIGRLGFEPGGASFSTGVVAGLSLPPYGVRVVDREFSVPFSLEVDQPASLFVGLGNDGHNPIGSTNVQVIFDFSDNIYFLGSCASILRSTRDQGLTLTSVTLEDGTPLEEAGLKFEFIPENTGLTAGASAFDATGVTGRTDYEIAASAPCGRAEVFLTKSVATAKLQGGFESRLNCEDGPATDALLDLDVNPEPDPYVYDFAYATISGANNVKLTTLSDNNPPTANAGENLAITSEEQAQCQTIIQGTATDPDNDTLQYRWLEEETEVLTWTPVETDGEANLDLCAASLGLGQHTLTLEVSDGQSTSHDDMILTIDNSAPHAAPTGGGVYSLGSSITVGGQVSDFDGDPLTYTWSDGYCSGNVQSVEGGTPVELPDCDVPPLDLGTHTLTLTVSDGINDPVSSNITIEVVDTTAPTLVPEPNLTILWPPNHKMVDITINANASDDSGLPPTLSAAVTSNEPQEGLGDGDMTPDWTAPVINQETGVITLQLRAERSGLGEGRIYTVAVTAVDDAGNTSSTNVEIIVPHDKGKK